MGQFVNGVLDGVNADDQQNAYYAGTQIGQQVVNQIIPGVTGELFGDKEGELNKKNFTTAFIAGVTEKGMKMTPVEAREKAMSLMTAIMENNDSTANLKAEIDTFSYAMGLAQTQGLKGFIMYRMGVDTTYMADFVKGLKTGIKAGDNAKQTAFYAGIQIGQQVGNQIIPGVSREVYGDSEELINKDFFLSGFIAGVTGKNLSMTPMEAQMTAMTLMEELKNARFEEQFGDNKAQGVAFLDSIAQTEGVVKTESGLCYKVITAGKGAIPTNTDKVKVHYRGTLIDGTEFDSSYSRNEPTTFRANQVIAGWTEALTMMPVGSKWMLYIPQELAYGSRDMGTIKPFSTLVFEVELLEIEK
jgi:FKBP-type peptidyl-prolyl cis-trans isomerase FklB